MAAEIEPETVALLGAREASDELLALEHDHAATALRKVQRRRQAGRTSPEDKDILTPHVTRAYPGFYDLP